MKLLVIILAYLTVMNTAGAGEEDLPPLPQHGGELMVWLDQALPDTTKSAIDALADGSETITFHFSLGMWLRNQLGLWGDEQAISQDLRARHIHDADFASTLILEWYWQHRKGQVPVLPMPLGWLPRPGEMGATWDAAEGIAPFSLSNETPLFAPAGAHLRVTSPTTEPEPVSLTDLCAAYAHPAWPQGQLLLLTGATTTPQWQLRMPDGTWHPLPHSQQTIGIISLQADAAHFGEWKDDPDDFGYRNLRWSLNDRNDLTATEWTDSRAWDTATWPQRRRQ